MTGVASSLWLHPTGGEAGGEIRNCLSGLGGSRRGLPIWTDCRKQEAGSRKQDAGRNKDKTMRGGTKVEMFQLSAVLQGL